MVADLLDILILSRTESKIYFLSKFSPQAKPFEILIIHILPPLKDLSKGFALYDKWEMRNDKWQMTNDNLKRTHDSWTIYKNKTWKNNHK